MSGSAGVETRKREAALAACDLLSSNDVVGLGTGSTARYFIEELGSRLRNGLLTDIEGVATSLATERQAAEAGVPLVDLPASGVAVAVDGMDEVDGSLRAIKGLGGALAREKIVAASARLFVLIGDAGKRVQQLAERTPVPVEILPFGWRRTALLLEELGLEPRLRAANPGSVVAAESAPSITDNGNWILDCRVRLPADLERLAERISALPGVVEHGLFLEQAGLALIASGDGVEELRRSS